MGSDSLKMAGKHVKRFGDAQKKKKQSEIKTNMTKKFLQRPITELSTRLPKLPTSKLGIKFAKMLGKTTKSQPPTLESCTLLLCELHVSDDMYQVTTLNAKKIAEEGRRIRSRERRRCRRKRGERREREARPKVKKYNALHVQICHEDQGEQFKCYKAIKGEKEENNDVEDEKHP